MEGVSRLLVGPYGTPVTSVAVFHRQAGPSPVSHPGEPRPPYQPAAPRPAAPWPPSAGWEGDYARQGLPPRGKYYDPSLHHAQYPFIGDSSDGYSSKHHRWWYPPPPWGSPHTGTQQPPLFTPSAAAPFPRPYVPETISLGQLSPHTAREYLSANAGGPLPPSSISGRATRVPSPRRDDLFLDDEFEERLEDTVAAPEPIITTAKQGDEGHGKEEEEEEKRYSPRKAPLKKVAAKRRLRLTSQKQPSASDPDETVDPFGIRDLTVKPPRQPPSPVVRQPPRPRRRMVRRAASTERHHPTPIVRARERPGAAGPAKWKNKRDIETDLEETRRYWRRRQRMLDEFQSRMFYRYELPTVCRLVESRLPELFSPPCLSTTPMYEFAISQG